MGQQPLSPGYHFLPNERELLWYLQKKIRGDDDGFVKEIDIYGDKNPWELFDKDVKKDHYVFAKLKKKSMSGPRIDRKAGSGTWKERQTKDQDKNDVQWVRKEFLFELGKKKKNNTEEPSNNGHWIMHEYSLNADVHKPNDYVICKIKNKNASQEDYGPGGLEGIERCLAQIRNLKQPAVKEQDDVVRSSNKRKLHIEEDRQQRQQLLKKCRGIVETLQFAEHVQQKQPGMQARSGYNVVDSNTFVSLPVDPISTLAGQYSCCDNTTFAWFEVQAEVNGDDTNLFAALTVDQIAALMDSANSFPYPEDQHQQEINNNCDNFQYGNGEVNLDPTGTPVLAAEKPLVAESVEQPSGASLSSEDANYQQMFDDPPEDFYFSLQGWDDPLEC